MKRTSIVILLFAMLFSLSACGQVNSPVSNSEASEEAQTALNCLLNAFDQLTPTPDGIAGTIEYRPDDAGDELMVYYTNANKLYYSNIKVNDLTVTNYGLVLTDSVLKPYENASVLYIEGAAIAKELGLPHISFEQFIATMNYSFEDVKNAAEEDTAEDADNTSQQAYLAEELLGKSAAEIIAIYGQGFIEVVPEGDPPYFYYEDGSPYLFVGDANSECISYIISHTSGCTIMSGVHIGDSLQHLETVVKNNSEYTYFAADQWYDGPDGKYGWVLVTTDNYYYSCYIKNDIIASFECWLPS